MAMSVAKAAEILDHYIRLACERDQQLSADSRGELMDAVNAFHGAAIQLDDLDSRVRRLEKASGATRRTA